MKDSPQTSFVYMKLVNQNQICLPFVLFIVNFVESSSFDGVPQLIINKRKRKENDAARDQLTADFS